MMALFIPFIMMRIKSYQIDSTDQIISATTSLNQLLGSAGLLAQADIQLLLKVQAAPSATERCEVSPGGYRG